jgi:uncharacterized membrane protein
VNNLDLPGAPALTPDEIRLQKSEVAISLFLKWGVYVTGAIMTYGCLLAFLNPSAWEHDQMVISQVRSGVALENPLFYPSLAELFTGLGHFESLAWMILGLALLVFLPVMRVALTLVIFTIQKDRVYMALSAFVLLILLLSAFLGLAI